MTLRVQSRDGAVEFAVKVVPGASRDRVVGLHGDALKVQVAAAAEHGKANARLALVLGTALGVPVRMVLVRSGHHGPRKTIAVLGLTADELRRRLGL